MARTARTAKNEAQVSNDAAEMILRPFAVNLKICGTNDILFHRWSNEAVAEKAAAMKGSQIKKQDNVESYVYRNEENQICIPGRYIVRAIVEAGRSYHDPRSARKMSKDLVQAGVICEESLSPILVAGEPVEDWEYLDQQRVVIQRNAITRTRPAFTKGMGMRVHPDQPAAGVHHPRVSADFGRRGRQNYWNRRFQAQPRALHGFPLARVHRQGKCGVRRWWPLENSKVADR